MRQFIIGALAGVGLLLVIGYAAGYLSKKNIPTRSVVRQGSTGREIVADVMDEIAVAEKNPSSAREIRVVTPPAQVTQVGLSPSEKEAMKQEIMNSIRAQMDICRPAPVCEEKKVVAAPVPVKKKVMRRRTSKAIKRKIVPAPIMTEKKMEPVTPCSETPAYRSCLNDRYSKWDSKCTTKTVEVVEAKPWKNDNRRMTRMESQATIIEIDAENICSSPRTEIERYCLQKVCLEVK